MNTGRQRRTLNAALLMSLLALGACDPGANDAAAPRAGATAPAGTLPPATGSTDPSLPPATSALPAPATGTAKDEAAATPSSNAGMTRSQESNAMPMAGQVNNHSSTALDPAHTRRGASAPGASAP